MTPGKIKASRLKARIDTLRRRHRELDTRITQEESRPSADPTQIKRLKQERLGLRDAIRVTQTVLGRLKPRHTSLGWQQQFHSG